MKNQYFGDVNDYRKYGLLRALGSVTQLPIGVCWLLTADDGRADGEFRRYLKEPDRWRDYDPELYDHLRRLLVPGASRSVSHARSWDLIPGATYHEALLQDDTPSRRMYFEVASAALEECPILFFDPDNGIEIPSKAIGTKDSAKYLYWQEIERAYEAGHSLVIYQHFPRHPRDAYTSKLAEQLAARLGAPLVDSFRTSHVVFFLAARPEHAGAFERAHAEIHKRWGGQIRASAHVSMGNLDPVLSNEQAADRFAKSAAAYCEVIEARARWSRAAFLRRVQEVLPSLYVQALVLPDVEPADDQERYPVLTIEDRTSIFKSVEELLGSHSLYWKVHDPIGEEPEEPLAGNLADDLVDIYCDLQNRLLGWRHGDPGKRQNALWEWRFDFQTHWGAHAVDAMRAIHWLLCEHHIEVMEHDRDAPSGPSET